MKKSDYFSLYERTLYYPLAETWTGTLSWTKYQDRWYSSIECTSKLKPGDTVFFILKYERPLGSIVSKDKQNLIEKIKEWGMPSLAVDNIKSATVPPFPKNWKEIKENLYNLEARPQ